MDTRRTMCCGAPNCDHVATPIRYRLRADLRHYLIQKARVMFGRSR